MQRVHRHNVDILWEVLVECGLFWCFDTGLARNGRPDLGRRTILTHDSADGRRLDTVDDKVRSAADGVPVNQGSDPRVAVLARKSSVRLGLVAHDDGVTRIAQPAGIHATHLYVSEIQSLRMVMPSRGSWELDGRGN